MTLDEYRQEHVDFHQNRVRIFMDAAYVVKQSYIDLKATPYMFELVRELVREARTENHIVRWWKHMSDEQLQRQIDFWN